MKQQVLPSWNLTQNYLKMTLKLHKNGDWAAIRNKSTSRRAEFTSSATLQAACGKRLQLHALQLASKANSTREISGLRLTQKLFLGEP